MQPVADGFINLIKMLIPAVILCTVVLGIAGAGSIRKAGGWGGKAILYFEVVSTFALVIGLFMANFFGPGEAFMRILEAGSKIGSRYVTQAQHMTVADHLLKMIPRRSQRLYGGGHSPGVAHLGPPGVRPRSPEGRVARPIME